MPEKRLERADTPEKSTVRTKAESDVLGSKSRYSQNLSRPDMWGPAATAFCEWCEKTGNIDSVESVVSACFKRGESERLGTFAEMNECPENPSDFPNFLQEFNTAFSDVKTDLTEAETTTEKAETTTEKAETTTEKAERLAKEAEKLSRLRSIAERLSKPQYAQILKRVFPGGDFDPANPEHLTDRKNLEAFEQAFSDPSLRKELFEAARESDAKTGGTDLRFFATQFRSLGLIDQKEFDSVFQETIPKSPSGEKPSDVKLAAAEGFRKADPQK